MTTQASSFASNHATAECIAELLAWSESSFGAQGPKLLFLFASTKQPLAELQPAIAKVLGNTLVLGASTAGEFTERGDHKGAVTAVGFVGDFEVASAFATTISKDPEGSLTRALEGVSLERSGYPFCTAISLLDPFVGNAEEITLLLASMLDPGARIAGGAAGDDLAMKQTFVGRNGDVASDAVAVGLIFSKRPLGIGVRHGHRAFSSYFEVTEAEGSLVKSLDGKPAWEVWREHVRPAAAEAGFDVDTLTGDTVGALLLRFEGALDVGDSIKVRAPLALDGTSIRFASDVPQGARMRITESTADRQVASALEAARGARKQLGESKVAGAVVFDCICRNLILGARFNDAVQGMAHVLGDVPLAGFETYGEIALDEGELSGFHNTTSVVLAFPEQDHG
ncbi:MAG: FIST N-terminal domain-containing protein [Deltaproteobacteria bacterium]|nr:FIST N-terminal domain-containing protein [Deltaproteobacteria bacterium]